MTHAIDFEPLAWQDDANCATTDPEVFFPDSGSGYHAAKKVCGACGVVEQCLQYALDTGQTNGIWGGLGVVARKKIKKARAT